MKRIQKRGTLLLIGSLFLTLLCGCSVSVPKEIRKTGLYFDTVISITLYDKEQEPYLDDCFALADRYESYFSATIADSDISKLNHNPGVPIELHSETMELLQMGMMYSQLSDGSFDITIGALSDLWNFGNEDFAVPSEDAIAASCALVDYHNIRLEGTKATLLTAGAKIDLGGIAKGYIADQMKEYLHSKGVNSGIINLGGNVLAVGPKESGEDETYSVAIQKPFSEDGEAAAVLTITDQSVVTSGTYQRYHQEDGQLYHHILDPRTGYPYDNGLSSVTIVSSTSVEGDALSTTVFTMGLEDGTAYVESLPDTEAVFITTDGEIYHTSGIGTKIPFRIL